MRPESKWIFGAEVQYFRLDPVYWPSVLQSLKSTGIRCVSTYVPWSTHLAGPPDAEHPAGVLDFDGRTDPRLNVRAFIHLVEEMGMRMNIRCGPFCCNEMVHGGLPPWLVLGDPSIMVWDSQNRTTQGYWVAKKEGSQPSYLHPEYLEWCRKWIAEVDRLILPHLACNGGCVTMVNLDNEISYIVQDGMLSSDYNPVNVGRGGYYHQFLREKYGSAQALPYKEGFGAIEDVQPPRDVPQSVDDNIAWYLDWMEFKEWCMCRYIEQLRSMHQDNGVGDVLFTTNINPHLPEGIPTRMPSFERATSGITGYDFYRGTFMSYSGYHSMARVLKLMNSSLSYTWSSEFMSGTWNKVLPSRVSDDHMSFMARCALAHGCKAITWFMFHDRECWGDAPVSSHGHRRTNLYVLRDTYDLCMRRIRGWDSLRVLTDVAVLYDLIQHRHTSIGDPSPCEDNRVHEGTPSIRGVQAGTATKEYIALFRLIEHTGCQAGVVDLLERSESLNGYRLAFLPGSPIIERKVNDQLLQWTASGGTLVVSGVWPQVDETGRELCFLGASVPGTQPVGNGRVIHHEQPLGSHTEPEKDDLSAVEYVSDLINRYHGAPHVRISPENPVHWVDWGENGLKRYDQPRNLGSAIIQQNETGEKLLFVLNHYPEATRFRLEFREKPEWLVCLDTGNRIEVSDGTVVLDIDRKSCCVYRLL